MLRVITPPFSLWKCIREIIKKLVLIEVHLHKLVCSDWILPLIMWAISDMTWNYKKHQWFLLSGTLKVVNGHTQDDQQLQQLLYNISQHHRTVWKNINIMIFLWKTMATESIIILMCYISIGASSLQQHRLWRAAKQWFPADTHTHTSIFWYNIQSE